MSLPPSPGNDFSEPLSSFLRRLILGFAFAVLPKRIGTAPFLFVQTVWSLAFPGPRIPGRDTMWRRPHGYGGPVQDDTPEGLMAGMKAGFYQMSNVWPRKWWAPDERAIMMIGDVHIQRRFRRAMKSGPFRVTIDTAFYDVVKACAAPRRRIHVSWLYPSTRKLLQDLHEKGHAHSVEVWDQNGDLVGGVFGVSLGAVFTAESMFHTANDASKLAILSLYQHLEAFGVTAVDHQMLRPWVEQMGARFIPHEDYLKLLAQPVPDRLKTGSWTVRFSAADTANWQPREQVKRAA